MNFVVNNYEAEMNQGEIVDIKIGFSANNNEGESIDYLAKVSKKDLAENQELKNIVMNDVITIALNKLKSYIAVINN
ncbi:hypothetical protein [Liquorilactobacillus hordei]|uniref:Uncharacterized protein n=1 Tax=Liquorilactobacillus hordei DSM 19519 TaxID=1423759 RepID=A0A0R1MSF5_9LACO|nr:hypothetical protein [Liquorilactobacillus hordei]KRL07930.1 hypothetical protein FC92_GL000997 [Liquorilactobacillus hordei DSM 19519]QYH51124.1 hypothetical protein G6O70_00770 [Liquorilactobacillus hordei DSM 19519]